MLAGVNTVGRTLLGDFAELVGRPPRTRARAAVELLLTLDEGRKEDARKWDTDEIKLEPPPSGSSPRIVAEARVLAERLRELVDDEGDA